MKTTKKVLAITVFILSAFSFRVSAVEVETANMFPGRPGYTVGASLMWEKSLMLETGLGFDHIADYRQFTINTSTLRYGFTHRFEGRFSLTETKPNEGSVDISLSLAAKIALVHNSKFKLSILPKIGYADSGNAMLSLLFSKKISEKWSLSANLAGTWDNTDDFDVVASAFVGYAVTNKLTASFEAGMANAYSSCNLGVALAYQVAPRLQLDISTTRFSDWSITGMSNKWNIEAGLCWLIK